MSPQEQYFSEINPKDIWLFPNISTKQQRKYYSKESLNHPAKMPTFLAQKLINSYSKEGETILDPMCGIGTTLIESALLGRNAIGIEYEEKFVEIAKANAKNIDYFRSKNPKMGQISIIHGDSRFLSKILYEQSADTIITIPPFENQEPAQDKKFKLHNRELSPAMKGSYTDNKNSGNLANFQEQNYLDAMLQVYQECFKILKQNGLMVLVLKNFLRKGELVRLDLDTIKICDKAGFVLLERKYRKLENASFWINNFKKKFYEKNPDKMVGHKTSDFEDILIFRKKFNWGV